MPLSKAQIDLLKRVEANYSKGLTSSIASTRRAEAATKDSNGGEGLNTVSPPLNCPSWVCCLLPCIKHIPSMKLFRQINPEDAEVLREGRWIRYDAASLVKGDIIRLTEGDVVPADCTLLALGMDPDRTISEEDAPKNEEEEEEDMIVDVSNITGEKKPRTASLRQDGTVNPIQMFYGGQVLQGSGVAVVTATGSNTLLASLIREGRWPPKGDLSEELGGGGDEDEDLEAGVSLLSSQD
mmetsp:Transcript_17911/g.25952  ORF Transcript_17911/g.25952 Transcript_17911/m.25952 type:complete len:239 (-) Transcript_17911:267-983(-)